DQVQHALLDGEVALLLGGELDALEQKLLVLDRLDQLVDLLVLPERDEVMYVSILRCVLLQHLSARALVVCNPKPDLCLSHILVLTG
ncbi:MAG: hypothetical protein ACPIOQ_77175, partial [Promethearchaeia archaeon]